MKNDQTKDLNQNDLLLNIVVETTGSVKYIVVQDTISKQFYQSNNTKAIKKKPLLSRD